MCDKLGYFGVLWSYLSIHSSDQDIQVIRLLCDEGCEFHLDTSSTDSSVRRKKDT